MTRFRTVRDRLRTVARVHTGETGTLVPVSRYHLAIWNDRARNVHDRSRPVASGQLCRVDARPGVSVRLPNQ